VRDAIRLHIGMLKTFGATRMVAGDQALSGDIGTAEFIARHSLVWVRKAGEAKPGLRIYQHTVDHRVCINFEERSRSGRKGKTMTGQSKKKGAKQKSKAAKPTSKKTAKAKAAPISISRQQWKMPVSYTADGAEMASLAQMVNPDVPTLSLPEMTPDQRAEIVARRIAAQPKYEISMVGVGTIDKQRAIDEVKAKSKIGQILMEIEQRVINNLVEEASKQKLEK
jgi:hypothetical protein